MQRILEYTGPFRIGQRIEITPEVNSQIIHIGIQVPYKWAIAIPETNMNPDEMEMIEATIQILKDLPKESIIDIVLYERTME